MTMARYRHLAFVYDKLSAEYDYELWVECALTLFRRYHPSGVSAARVLDLGCGTGRASLELHKRGYEVTGVDASPDMLSIAAERFSQLGVFPTLVCQDMRMLDLGTAHYHLAVALCDTLNYLTTLPELVAVLKRVHAVLEPGGVLVFDLNTIYKLATVYGDNTYIDEDEGCFITWENQWDEGERICSMELNIFLRAEHGWRRSTELHVEKAYTPAEVIAALSEAGFVQPIGPLAAFDMAKPTEQSERVFYAAQKARSYA
ncbi:MAG TPA: class I SAM-dependent methyltransferase [Firmicutes bacterium]|nr:class I SAM-dependent methyltransferase [Bacillota bacterium]